MPEPAPEPNGSGLPAHEQQAWDAIVAGLRDEMPSPPPSNPPSASAAPPPPPLAATGDHPDPLAEHPELDESDEHRYEPPEPPPLPRPHDTMGKFVWAGVAGGPALVLIANVLNWESWIAGIGVAAFVGGIAGLIARMKDEREDDGNDGAVV
jgi:hypothetical protein